MVFFFAISIIHCGSAFVESANSNIVKQEMLTMQTGIQFSILLFAVPRSHTVEGATIILVVIEEYLEF